MSKNECGKLHLFHWHVLYHVPLHPSQHLHEAVLGCHHVVVALMQRVRVLLKEGLVIFNCPL